jgi:tRNA threonylcarbamoyladenosine biosynthesis protein TsaB
MDGLILAMETTAPVASVALARDGKVLSLRFSDREMNHLTELMPMVRDTLAENGVMLADLAALAVSAGPGSFTGMRIGVSTARALSQVSGVPVIAVPTLETFAFQESAEGKIVCPILDARLNQVYAGAYRLHITESANMVKFTIDQTATKQTDATQTTLEILVPGGAYKYEEFLSLAEATVVGMGDKSELLLMPDEECPRDASQTAAWAYAFGEPRDYRTLEPIYIRKAEAQRRLDEGLLKPKG